MLLYQDAGALVKRYVEEAGSREVATIIGEATAVATSILSRAEGEPLRFATYDRQLWQAGDEGGLAPFPENNPRVRHDAD